MPVARNDNSSRRSSVHACDVCSSTRILTGWAAAASADSKSRAGPASGSMASRGPRRVGRTSCSTSAWVTRRNHGGAPSALASPSPRACQRLSATAGVTRVHAWVWSACANRCSTEPECLSRYLGSGSAQLSSLTTSSALSPTVTVTEGDAIGRASWETRASRTVVTAARTASPLPPSSSGRTTRTSAGAVPTVMARPSAAAPPRPRPAGQGTRTAGGTAGLSGCPSSGLRGRASTPGPTPEPGAIASR